MNLQLLLPPLFDESRLVRSHLFSGLLDIAVSLDSAPLLFVTGQFGIELDISRNGTLTRQHLLLVLRLLQVTLELLPIHIQLVQRSNLAVTCEFGHRLGFEWGVQGCKVDLLVARVGFGDPVPVISLITLHKPCVGWDLSLLLSCLAQLGLELIL